MYGAKETVICRLYFNSVSPIVLQVYEKRYPKFTQILLKG
jgi:hypothetical protein